MIEPADLSEDARVVMGSLFGLGVSHLTFTMERTRPTDRAQKALDELVAAGALHREVINLAGSVRYRPVVDVKPFREWFVDNQDKTRHFLLSQHIGAPA